ncbi:MAG: PTS sugar transporter subunit IIA [Spirochaetaceae bacterium]
MKRKQLLSPDRVILPLHATTKDEVIEELLDLLMKSGKVKDRGEALTALKEREEKMSTGMEKGVAIPHGKCGCVDELVVAAGIAPEGIDFDALDKKPSYIFIMTLSPKDRSGPHIQFLAEISQLLKHKEAREALLRANSPEEAVEIFQGKSQ